MAPLRWPCALNDLKLATETAARRPQCPADWEEIRKILSAEFSTEQREVKLTGRACGERLDLLIAKYIEDDKKARQDFRITPHINYAYIHCLKNNTMPLGFQQLF